MIAALLRLYRRWTDPDIHWLLFDGRRACDGGPAVERDTCQLHCVTCPDCQTATLFSRRALPRIVAPAEAGVIQPPVRLA